jgi:hypothetical protein
MIADFFEWKKKLLRSFDIAIHGHKDNEVYEKALNEYLMLIEEVLKNDDARGPKALLELYTNEPDYGLLESCFRVLSNVKHELFLPAFIQSFQSLLERSEEWTSDLFDHALKTGHFGEYISKIASTSEKLAIKKFANTFIENYPESEKLCNDLLLYVQ